MRTKSLVIGSLLICQSTVCAFASDGDQARTFYDVAVREQQEGKLAEAIADYRRAIAEQPNEASFYYALGTAYQGQSDIDAAIQNYLMAVSLNPKESSYRQTLKAAKEVKAAPLIQSAIAKQTSAHPDLAGAKADYEAARAITGDSEFPSLQKGYYGNFFTKPDLANMSLEKATQKD